MSKKDFSYYSFDSVLGHNAVINMVMGARGLGKTYGAKKIVIRNAIRKGEQFIYLRRYKSELKGRNSFFADIAHEFPGYSFRVNGNDAQLQLEGDKEWQTIGYFVPLSTSQANKSIAYPLVTTIIFDEFVIERGNLRYLPNEVKTLLDFYSTVDRYDDRVRVLMLSNAISIMNPYFIKWNINPGREFVRRGDGFICAHFVDSNRFASEVARTRFGSFIINHDEEYADYSISNQFADSNDDFVLRKTGRARYYFTLRTPSGSFSVWIDGLTWFAQEKCPSGSQVLYTTCRDMREGEILLHYSDKILQMMRTKYKNGRMFFDTPRSRNAFKEIFTR